MNIKLIRLNIENFKGVKAFEADFDGENAVIKGANGTGKTTVFDAFLWLLFGKDSTGRKDFELRPLNENNQPIKGLVTMVEAEISFDGINHTLKKENHENVVKGQLRGYETLCWVDEVPKKVGEYNDYITDLINEDTFKLLTDLHYFNEKLHWKDRRKVLLDIAGNIGKPDGFEELTAVLNGRSVDEYKKVLAEQKKRLVKERDEINPRIDELQKSLKTYAKVDNSAIEKDRKAVKAEIDELDKSRQAILAQEKERQVKIEQLNQLKASKLSREIELKNDTAGIKKYLDEKAKIEKGVAKCKQALAEINNQILAEQRVLANDKEELDSCLRNLNKIRDEYTKANEPSKDLNCYACGQKLPENKIAEIEQKRKAELTEIAKRGNGFKADADKCKKAISDSEAKIKAIQEQIDQAKVQVQEAERLPKIDEVIKNRPAPDFTADEKWQKITADIAKAETEIGQPVSAQLETIEAQRKAKTEELAVFDRALAQSDNAKQAAKRIKELELKENELAQQIADIDRLSAMIDQYKAAESSMIENAVNCRFKYVKFKLFSELLNGGLEDCCEAMLNGVPYSDMSCGQKILVGIDIVNVLSEHYEISVPLFIDNAESLTLPVEAECQVIELYAQSNINQIVIEKKGELIHV